MGWLLIEQIYFLHKNVYPSVTISSLEIQNDFNRFLLPRRYRMDFYHGFPLLMSKQYFKFLIEMVLKHYLDLGCIFQLGFWRFKRNLKGYIIAEKNGNFRKVMVTSFKKIYINENDSLRFPKIFFFSIFLKLGGVLNAGDSGLFFVSLV